MIEHWRASCTNCKASWIKLLPLNIDHPQFKKPCGCKYPHEVKYKLLWFGCERFNRQEILVEKACLIDTVANQKSANPFAFKRRKISQRQSGTMTYRQARQQKGLCIVCSKPIDDGRLTVFCRACQDKEKMKPGYRGCVTERKMRLKRDGRCVVCATPINDPSLKTNCRKCQDRTNAHRREKRAKKEMPKLQQEVSMVSV
jgi:hypothetical protein